MAWANPVCPCLPLVTNNGMKTIGNAARRVHCDIFLLSLAAEGIEGELDFFYRFKYLFIMDTNFRLSLGVNSPIIASAV